MPRRAPPERAMASRMARLSTPCAVGCTTTARLRPAILASSKSANFLNKCFLLSLNRLACGRVGKPIARLDKRYDAGPRRPPGILAARSSLQQPWSRMSPFHPPPALIENRPPHRSFTPQCTEPRVNFPRASREIQQRPVARRGCRSERGQVIEEDWRHMLPYEVQSFQNCAGDSKL